MESKIEQNDNYFFGNLEILFQIQIFNFSAFIFRKLHSRISDFLLFRDKKLSGQIVVCFQLYTYKSQCFKKFYEFILGHGLDRPDLNRMTLKKDMRNLFFKRVTDIIIPDYPLSIDM